MAERLVAAADGSALGNPGPAGWAWYVDRDRWAAGGWPHGTNNMGELMAVLDLLRATRDVPALTILCDSQYVINSVTKWMAGWKRKGWKKGDGKPVLNLELMQGIDEEMSLPGRDVRFEWVKGHAGHPLNEAADRLANGAALTYQRGGEPDPGPGLGGAARPSATTGSAGARSPGKGPRSEEATSTTSVAATAGGALADLPEADDDIDRVIELERGLLTDAVRTSPRFLDRLLHPDWVEFGSSGRIMKRETTLDRLGPVDIDLEVVEATKLAPDVVLLLWRSHSGEGAETVTRLRSSVWVRDGEAWRQRFHQGTPQA